MKRRIFMDAVRKLHALELVHLRTLVAEQQREIERLEAEREEAEIHAEFWREGFMALEAAELDSSTAVGLTKDGALVRVERVQ